MSVAVILRELPRIDASPAYTADAVIPAGTVHEVMVLPDDLSKLPFSIRLNVLNPNERASVICLTLIDDTAAVVLFPFNTRLTVYVPSDVTSNVSDASALSG